MKDSVLVDSIPGVDEVSGARYPETSSKQRGDVDMWSFVIYHTTGYPSKELIHLLSVLLEMTHGQVSPPQYYLVLKRYPRCA